MEEFKKIDRDFVLSYNISVWSRTSNGPRVIGVSSMGNLTAREAGEALDLEHIEVIRRIRRGQIRATKLGGWFWIIRSEEVQKVKKKPWYKHLMQLRARRAKSS